MHVLHETTSTTASRWGPTTAGRRRPWPRSGSTPPTAACGPTADDLSKWWTVFNDPALDNLICCAYRQNLTLREAGFRVLEARAQLAIAAGQLFPQSQTMTGSYSATPPAARSSAASSSPGRSSTSGTMASISTGNWTSGAASAGPSNPTPPTLDASVEDYDDMLVTLLGDVATNYVQMRTLEERHRLRRKQRAIAARDADHHRGPLPRRHDQRTGRLPGPQHAGTDARPRFRSWRSACGRRSNAAVHPAGHAAGGVAGAARPGAHPHGAAGGGGRHSGRPVAPPSRRAPGGAPGGRPERADRRGRGRFLSGHFDQRHARLLGRSNFPTCSAPRPSTATSALRSNGTC